MVDDGRDVPDVPPPQKKSIVYQPLDQNASSIATRSGHRAVYEFDRMMGEPIIIIIVDQDG
jgi:hypothetical protein